MAQLSDIARAVSLLPALTVPTGGIGQRCHSPQIVR